MAYPSIPGFKPILGDIDAEENFETETEIGMVVGIEYTDANNFKTRRRISFSRVNETTGTISAYCLERAAPRSFRIDRINCFIDLDGQVFSPPDFFSLLGGPNGPHIQGETKQRPPVWEIFWRRLVIFCAMGHSDGFMHEEEVEAVCVAMLDHAERDGLFCKDPEIEALRARIRRIKITAQDAINAAKKLSTQPVQSKKRIMRSLARIANTDGEQHEGEFDLLIEIQRALRLSD